MRGGEGVLNRVRVHFCLRLALRTVFLSIYLVSRSQRCYDRQVNFCGLFLDAVSVSTGTPAILLGVYALSLSLRIKIQRWCLDWVVTESFKILSPVTFPSTLYTVVSDTDSIGK